MRSSRSTQPAATPPGLQQLEVLDQQSVVVVGTHAVGLVIPHLARQLMSLHAQRVDVATHLEATVKAHSLNPVMRSMLGVAVRTAAIIIAQNLRQDLHQRRSTVLLSWTRAHDQAIRNFNQIRTRQRLRE